MRKLWAGIAVIALAVGLTPRPAAAGSGTEAASFLDIPVGARPAALGDAYTALAEDAYAVTANPGGLAFLPQTQLAGQHLSYLESIHYEYLSFVHPLHKGSALGGSVQYLGSGDMAQTGDSGQALGQFSSHYAAYSLAYGHSLGEKWGLGIAAKVIDAKIADVSARSFAGDLGALYRMRENLQWAATVSNLGSKLTFLNDGGSLPLAGKVGAAYEPNNRCTLTAQGVYRNTGLVSGHFGAEWRPLEMIAIRAGYRTDTTKELGAMAGLTAGIGVSVWGQELAYAWLPYGDLGNTQYFSLLARFGVTENAKRNLIQYQNIRRPRTAKEKSLDPDYQQLMQLLSDDDHRELYSHRTHERDSE